MMKFQTIKQIILLLTFLGVLVFAAEAKKNTLEEVDIYELSIDENIATPKLGKLAPNIVAFQDEQVKYLKSLADSGYPYEVKAIRNSEVIMITIEMRRLFDSNSTELTESGKRLLEPFLKYLTPMRLYKMVLVAHSDNTGSEQYMLDLTTKRVNAVNSWIEKLDSSKTDMVVPYALGCSDPIVDNNSIMNRAKNRRLVIYLIPNNAMILQAKKNKISL